jgi:hypothetical protein
MLIQSVAESVLFLVHESLLQGAMTVEFPCSEIDYQAAHECQWGAGKCTQSTAL